MDKHFSSFLLSPCSPVSFVASAANENEAIEHKWEMDRGLFIFFLLFYLSKQNKMQTDFNKPKAQQLNAVIIYYTLLMSYGSLLSFFVSLFCWSVLKGQTGKETVKWKGKFKEGKWEERKCVGFWGAGLWSSSSWTLFIEMRKCFIKKLCWSDHY